MQLWRSAPKPQATCWSRCHLRQLWRGPPTTVLLPACCVQRMRQGQEARRAGMAARLLCGVQRCQSCHPHWSVHHRLVAVQLRMMTTCRRCERLSLVGNQFLCCPPVCASLQMSGKSIQARGHKHTCRPVCAPAKDDCELSQAHAHSWAQLTGPKATYLTCLLPCVAYKTSCAEVMRSSQSQMARGRMRAGTEGRERVGRNMAATARSVNKSARGKGKQGGRGCDTAQRNALHWDRGGRRSMLQGARGKGQ